MKLDRAWIDRWVTAVNGDAACNNNGRGFDGSFSLVIGETRYTLHVHGGRVERTVVDGGPLEPSRFTLAADSATWEALFAPDPPPMGHAIFAAVATGNVDGLFFEVHPDPDTSPSDGANMVQLDDFPEIAIEPLDAADDVPAAGPPSSAPFSRPSTSEYDRGVYHTPAQVNTLTDYSNPGDPGIVSADEFASMSGSIRALSSANSRLSGVPSKFFTLNMRPLLRFPLCGMAST